MVGQSIVPVYDCLTGQFESFHRLPPTSMTQWFAKYTGTLAGMVKTAVCRCSNCPASPRAALADVVSCFPRDGAWSELARAQASLSEHSPRL